MSLLQLRPGRHSAFDSQAGIESAGRTESFNPAAPNLFLKTRRRLLAAEPAGTAPKSGDFGYKCGNQV
jgi:hypothetical protein